MAKLMTHQTVVLLSVHGRMYGYNVLLMTTYFWPEPGGSKEFLLNEVIFKSHLHETIYFFTCGTMNISPKKQFVQIGQNKWL